MSAVATTKLSSKGQVVIPEDVRKELGLEPGAQFVVMGEGDVVILKKIEAPDRQEFRALARKVRGQARRAGMKRSDVKKAVRATRPATCDAQPWLMSFRSFARLKCPRFASMNGQSSGVVSTYTCDPPRSNRHRRFRP